MTRYTARGRDRTRLHTLTGAMTAYHAVHHRLDATLGFLATIAGNDGQRAATTDPSGTGSHGISDPTGTNATTPKPPDDHEKLIRAIGQATRGLDDIAAIIRNNDPDRTVIATDPHCGHEIGIDADKCLKGCHDAPRTCVNCGEPQDKGQHLRNGLCNACGLYKRRTGRDRVAGLSASGLAADGEKMG